MPGINDAAYPRLKPNPSVKELDEVYAPNLFECGWVEQRTLSYRTLNGAQVGDLFMSLIHSCQLCGANSLDYLAELQRHARELAVNPAEWMPWNYRQNLHQLEA